MVWHQLANNFDYSNSMRRSEMPYKIRLNRRIKEIHVDRQVFRIRVNRTIKELCLNAQVRIVFESLTTPGDSLQKSPNDNVNDGASTSSAGKVQTDDKTKEQPVEEEMGKEK